jgi:hypothetical protein
MKRIVRHLDHTNPRRSCRRPVVKASRQVCWCQLLFFGQSCKTAQVLSRNLDGHDGYGCVYRRVAAGLCCLGPERGLICGFYSRASVRKSLMLLKPRRTGTGSSEFVHVLPLSAAAPPRCRSADSKSLRPRRRRPGWPRRSSVRIPAGRHRRSEGP